MSETKNRCRTQCLCEALAETAVSKQTGLGWAGLASSALVWAVWAGLGWAGLAQPDSKKVFSILGLVISQITLAIPLYLLFELGILLSKIFKRKNKK